MKQDTPQTANAFLKKLAAFRSEQELNKVERFFRGEDKETRAFGVTFGDVFRTAKEFTDMDLLEVERLLESPFYEVRMGAVSIMDYQAKRKSTAEQRRKELFDLYLNRHDRLNNWDFVDRGAGSIIGEYLVDKPRDILYTLAGSQNIWERRTSIVATHAFIKRGDLNDTFRIAEILRNDTHELIHKAVGSWVREAGKKDENRLRHFLDQYANSLPRVTLRYATEKLDPAARSRYLGRGK